MTIADVKRADTALTQLCAIRATVAPEAFYRQCDRLLDMRNRAALVVQLETEHVELIGAR